MTEKEPVPSPRDADDAPAKDAKPAPDGPREIEDAARQESEYPEDETDEG